MTTDRPIAAIRADIHECVGDDYRLLGLLVDLEDAAVAAYLASPETAEALLAALSEDDLMYDHPVAMSGEPMDPVLFVRWDAILAAWRETGRSEE